MEHGKILEEAREEEGGWEMGFGGEQGCTATPGSGSGGLCSGGCPNMTWRASTQTCPGVLSEAG